MTEREAMESGVLFLQPHVFSLFLSLCISLPRHVNTPVSLYDGVSISFTFYLSLFLFFKPNGPAEVQCEFFGPISGLNFGR